MRLDHIGVAVRSLEAAAESWQRQFGYAQVTEAVVNTRQGVKVLFLERAGSIPIKLIEPTGESSPIFGFVKRGGGVHHLAFRVDNIEESLEDLTSKGARVLVPPEPGEAFENEPIAFVLAQSGLNVELISTDRRAGRIRLASAAGEPAPLRVSPHPD